MEDGHLAGKVIHHSSPRPLPEDMLGITVWPFLLGTDTTRTGAGSTVRPSLMPCQFLQQPGRQRNNGGGHNTYKHSQTQPNTATNTAKNKHNKQPTKILLEHSGSPN